MHFVCQDFISIRRMCGNIFIHLLIFVFYPNLKSYWTASVQVISLPAELLITQSNSELVPSFSCCCCASPVTDRHSMTTQSSTTTTVSLTIHLVGDHCGDILCICRRLSFSPVGHSGNTTPLPLLFTSCS